MHKHSTSSPKRENWEKSNIIGSININYITKIIYIIIYIYTKVEYILVYIILNIYVHRLIFENHLAIYLARCGFSYN